MQREKILIADDEPDILELLEYALRKEGYEVIRANDGEETLELAQKHLPDIIILDIMMPKLDGVSVCQQLRQDPRFKDVLIVILTARSEEYSEVAGFEAGADDYVSKPVKLRSLFSRLEALRRRSNKGSTELLRVGPFTIDRERYLIFKEEEEIRLPRKEFELLHLLASNRNKVVSRERIFEEVWGKGVVVLDRTIDVHVRRIRIKIGDEHIVTVKGVGYKFVG